MNFSLPRIALHRFRMQSLVVMVMVVGAFPIIAFVALIFAQIFQQQEEQARDAVVAQARAIVTALDREFSRTHSVLYALGNAETLEAYRPSQFHSRAKLTAVELGSNSIVLVDRTGQLLLSTRRPFGTVLPRFTGAPLLTRTLTTGLPGISDLFANPVDQQLIYTLSVPIRQRGEIIYSLNATYTPDALAGVLLEQHLPPSWRAAIIDRQGTIVCRTHEAARFAGRPVSPKLMRSLKQSDEGSFDDVTLDGIAVMTGFSRSPTSQWSVAIGIPIEETSEIARSSILKLGILFVTALLVGIAITWWLGGRFKRSMLTLTEAVKQIEQRHSIPSVPETSFLEAHELGVVLVKLSRDAENTSPQL